MSSLLQVPKRIQVVRLRGVGQLELCDEPTPTPAEGETLVRIQAVGLCGSDLHWWNEGGIGDARLAEPLVLGHEFAGITPEGRRVAVDPAIPCGRCEFCREGNPNFCVSMRFAGHERQDGALREWAAWPAECLHPLPDSMTEIEGALLEPLGVALHATDLGHLRPGMSVGVFGCGPIGLMIVQLARVAGATTILATEVLPHRLDAALEYGATAVFPAVGGEEAKQVLAATGGRGVDVAFEVAGANPAVQAAIAAAKPGARVVLVGIPAEDRTEFTASVARRKGLTIKLTRRMKMTYPRAISLVASGRVQIRSIATRRFPLEQSEQAFAAASRREGLKVIVEPRAR